MNLSAVGLTIAMFGCSGADGTRPGGTLRFDPDGVRVDSVSAGVITNNASSVRMCKGDSGSPAMVYNSPGHPITMGVHSSSPQRTNGCATPGTPQTWAQAETEIGFINQGFVLFGAACTNVSYVLAPNITMSVRECW